MSMANAMNTADHEAADDETPEQLDTCIMNLKQKKVQVKEKWKALTNSSSHMIVTGEELQERDKQDGGNRISTF